MGRSGVGPETQAALTLNIFIRNAKDLRKLWLRCDSHEGGCPHGGLSAGRTKKSRESGRIRMTVQRGGRGPRDESWVSVEMRSSPVAAERRLGQAWSPSEGDGRPQDKPPPPPPPQPAPPPDRPPAPHPAQARCPALPRPPGQRGRLVPRGPRITWTSMGHPACAILQAARLEPGSGWRSQEILHQA
jgi:hypothetical protein